MANRVKHDGSRFDLIPLRDRRDADERCSLASQAVARALLDQAWWPEVVALTYHLPLTHPETEHLREIARCGVRDSATIHRALVDYVEWLQAIGQFVAAIYFAEVARDLAGEYVSFGLLIALATLYRQAARYEEAWETWETMEAMAMKVGSEEYRLRALNGKGIIRRHRGNLEEAAVIFRHVLAEAVGLPEIGGHAAVNLGTALERMGRDAEAIEAYWQGFNTFPSYQLTHKYRALLNVGCGLTKQGHLLDACRAFWLVEQMSHDWNLETNALIERLDVASMLHDKFTLPQIENALALRAHKMPVEVKTDYYFRLAQWAQREGETAKASRLYDHALKLAERGKMEHWTHRIRAVQEDGPATPERREDHRLTPIMLDLDVRSATAGAL